MGGPWRGACTQGAWAELAAAEAWPLGPAPWAELRSGCGGRAPVVGGGALRAGAGWGLGTQTLCWGFPGPRTLFGRRFQAGQALL